MKRFKQYISELKLDPSLTDTSMTLCKCSDCIHYDDNDPDDDDSCLLDKINIKKDGRCSFYVPSKNQKDCLCI